MTTRTGGPFLVRAARAEDAPALCDILNRIIEIGGTTAHETPYSPAAFDAAYISGPAALSCLLAAAPGGDILGFQTLSKDASLDADWADIGTFTRREPPRPGVGRKLFEETRARLGDLGVVAVNAQIRADNAGGLAYYEKMGFSTYRVIPDAPLKSGARVDRICKVFRPAPGLTAL